MTIKFSFQIDTKYRGQVTYLFIYFIKCVTNNKSDEDVTNLRKVVLNLYS